MSLPSPVPGRFRPLRCGLVEMFLYEAQEFPFRDGRLLLRGDNGSGKSKVLALTLPLLLDASLNPARMEPDGDPKKGMAWNLLMGDEHEERTGYSWVEFGRIDEEGTEHFVTLGLGVKAVRQRGVVRHWWFLSDQRIGEELHLVDRTRTARTRERLAEAIGDRGTVFDTAERYRRAVDEALFGLHARYGALVDLLVQLRQPQLSKRPNEELLGRALTEALPPVPESLIETVAQSYQALEDEERALGALRSGAAAVRAFSQRYSRYAAVAARRATATPRGAQSEYERQNRAAQQAAVRLETAEHALAEAKAAVESDKQELAALEGRREALRGRRGSDDLAPYDAAQRHAATTRTAADAAAEARANAEVSRRNALAVLERTRADSDKRERNALKEEALFGALAKRAGIEIEVSPGRADFGLALDAEVSRRGSHLAHLDELVTTRRGADQARLRAEQATGDAETRFEDEDGRMRESQSRADEVASAWLDRVRDHLTVATWLTGEGFAETIEAAAAWCAIPDGENPVEIWARAARWRQDSDVSAQEVAANTERRRLEPQLAALAEEIATLAAGGVVRPRAPHTRAATRDSATGAAFWECVDVLPGLSADAAAGFEAALEAAGLLDAWIEADGSAVAVKGDVLLRPAPLDGRTLADILAPVAVAGVPEARIDALLRSVALDEDPLPGSVAVSSHGSFALGPLTGSWAKVAAEYLGASARERARLDRLEAATAESDALRVEKDSWLSQLDDLGARREALAREYEGIPSDGPVRQASQEAVLAARRRADAAAALEGHRSGLARAREEHAIASATVDEASGQYAIDLGEIEAVRAILLSAPDDGRRLGAAIADRDETTARVAVDEATAEEAAVKFAEADHRADIAEQEAIKAAHRRDTLEATIGVEVREIERQLEEVEHDFGELGSARERHDIEREKVSNERAVAASDVVRLEETVADAARSRDDAAAEFRLFAATGLLSLAVPGIEAPDPDVAWSPDPTVRLARRVLEALGGQDASPEEWDRAIDRLREAFDTAQSELSVQGRQAAWEQQHGVTVVTIQHGSAYVAPELLAVELDAELADRERLLTERERAILETHLIDEVGAQLHERVQEAGSQVDRMNAELGKRTTRSGLKLRILWEPLDDELDRQGRRLLQQSTAAWSPADREAIGEYLRARISAARIEDADGSWHERLAHAFDYRAWNRFSVQLHQNGSWRPASGPASGGERVLAASVPLFAAAASHYASAGNPHAPRLILLDEAFAGVDDRSRASYLGLLTEFDLDVVMTSEREWATYPEIPGIAIAHLFRLPGTHAVHVEHWTWDGILKAQASDPGTTAIEEAPQPDPAQFAFDLGDLG